MARTGTLNRNNSRHCIRCGKAGPFRSTKALRCKACDKVAAGEKKHASAVHQMVQYRALKRLRKEYPDRYFELLAEERPRVERAIRREAAQSA